MSVLAKSPWVVHFNCNSCNGCDIEFLACLCPTYDVERFGVVHVGNPKHADILVVTGSVNHRNARVLANVYQQMPSPKVVVACGVCTSSGGIFADCYNVLGGVDKFIPVDVFVPGCPPRPEAMIDGIVKAVGILAAKAKGIETPVADKPRITVSPSPKPVDETPAQEPDEVGAVK
ncbi:MAG: NADH:ubiquinone oxidoreductase [Planctomycetes bacterium GWF2_50_10]|nr:MAG: NADH:ubiquinone oxidoreductase [Planctomycetes bacterium GWF2_50_10]